MIVNEMIWARCITGCLVQLVSNVKVNLSQPLPPQLVCNQDNHSVVFTVFKAAVFEGVSVQTLGNSARISNE